MNHFSIVDDSTTTHNNIDEMVEMVVLLRVCDASLEATDKTPSEHGRLCFVRRTQ